MVEVVEEVQRPLAGERWRSAPSTQPVSDGSMHWTTFAPSSAMYQSGNPSSGLMESDTAARPPVAVPVSGIAAVGVCALDVTLTWADIAPAGAANGANRTPIVHEVPGSTVVPVSQLLLASVNCELSAPVMVTSVITSGAAVGPFGFEIVTSLIGLVSRIRTEPKPSEVGVAIACATAPAFTLLPVRLMSCGVRKPVLVSCRRAVCRPSAAAGVNVTCTWAGAVAGDRGAAGRAGDAEGLRVRVRVGGADDLRAADRDRAVRRVVAEVRQRQRGGCAHAAVACAGEVRAPPAVRTGSGRRSCP